MNFYSLDDIPEHLQQYFQPAPQIGLEPTVNEYVTKMVQVFREVRRVLRDDGTVWLNLGDSYAGNGTGAFRPGNGRADGNVDAVNNIRNRNGNGTPDGLKPKDLIGIPWRVAFALQADGWWLRSDIIWAKPNPMPESVTDRPTKAHEYLFLLAKRERYFYDAEAIKEPAVTDDMRRPYGSQGAWQMDGRPVEQRPNGKPRTAGNKTHKYVAEYEQSDSEEHRTKAGLLKVADVPWYSRNRRSVWTIATKPYSEAHFATYPVDLVEPCIKAGTSAHGCCEACGAPWVRVVEGVRYEPPTVDVGVRNVDMSRGDKTRKLNGKSDEWKNTAASRTTTGWEPSCTCTADVMPATVLDPFSGAATTGVAAIGLGRNYIGIELNPEYIKLAERRLQNTQPALIAAD